MTERLSARDFAPEVLKLFDRYVHGGLSRRGFLEQAQQYAVGTVGGAAGLLAALSPQFAAAQQVKPDDARLAIHRAQIDSPAGNGSIQAYLAWPKGATGKLPVVMVVHENRGLNPHIEDIARRLALDGFLAVAPDALTPLGGYPGDEDKARDLFGKLDAPKTRADMLAVARHLLTVPMGNGRLGVVGFCWGGGIANYLATEVPELKASVPFYGAQPAAADVARIKAPLLIHYAGEDERINAGWPAYEQALKANHIPYQAFIYAGAQHGFNNDTTPRFDAAAAKLAWDRTVTFFNEKLKS